MIGTSDERGPEKSMLPAWQNDDHDDDDDNDDDDDDDDDKLNSLQAKDWCLIGIVQVLDSITSNYLTLLRC